MKIVSISGLDGSGKSTQIKLLQEYLESQGKKVFYFHAVQFSLPNKLAGFFSCHSERIRQQAEKPKNLGSEISRQTRDDNTAKGVTKANWFQIGLRKLVLPIDICRFKKLLKKLEKKGFDYLVSDRYFYDNIINIVYLSGKKPNTSNLKPRTCIDVPRPDFAFYLKTDPAKIMQRDRVPDQGLAYLEAKKKLLDEYAPIFGLATIDGNRSKEEIFGEIKSIISIF